MRETEKMLSADLTIDRPKSEVELQADPKKKENWVNSRLEPVGYHHSDFRKSLLRNNQNKTKKLIVF